MSRKAVFCIVKGYVLHRLLAMFLCRAEITY